MPDLEHPASACVAASDAIAGAHVPPPGVRVKVASEAWEFAAIHRLNYRTFVEEIPQHQANADGVLVDRFDRENTYIIALDGRRLLGMIAVRGTRPFSLDAKLPDLDAYLPPAQRVCEFRLLAVDPAHRAGRLLQPLIEGLWRHCEASGYDLALISGTTRQTKLYAHLGFVPFGPRVGTPGAEYQPMMLTLAAAQTVVRNVVRGRMAAQPRAAVNLLPGPVTVTPAVQTALSEAPASHRSSAFAAHFAAVQGQLRALTGSMHVQLLLGSGTLANDAVAAQLSLCGQRGLILSNGEFGERLADHARRFGLRFATVEAPWGRPIDLDLVERALQERPSWMWFVHLETSSGVVNDATALQAMCAGRGVDVCVDAISALGNVAVDLRAVRFATGVSGKGLGAFPGVALVFHDRPVAESGGRLPRYLDLGLYARDRGVPFTHSSNLVAALEASLDRQDWETRFAAVAAQTRWLRARLERRGFRTVAAPDHQGPGIVTIALPPSTRSIEIADVLDGDGFEVSARSRYLVDRNWLQFSVMGSPSRDELRGLLDALCRAAC